MSDGHGHQPTDKASDTVTDTARDTAIVVTAAEAARMVSVSARTIRRWIQQGWLMAIESEQGQLVSPADLPLAAERARRGRGHGHGYSSDDRDHSGGHGHQARDTATVMDTATATSVTGRAQLDAIMHEWLAPLIDRIAVLEREAGGLEADNRTKDQMISTQSEELGRVKAERDDLRRRVEQAEAERDRLAAAQAAPDASGSTEAVSATNPSPEPAVGFWARVRRAFGVA